LIVYNQTNMSKGPTIAPDTSAGAELWEDGSLGAWEAQLARYRSVLDCLKPGTDLGPLDRWYCELQLGGSLSKQQLSKLMRWKLLRGKWRPLQKRVDSIDAKVLEATYSAAHALYAGSGDVRQLLNLLGPGTPAMTGVGAATATAIASCMDDCIPFLSDSAMLSIPSLGKKQYSLAHFDRFAAEVEAKTRWLARESKRGGGGVQWTARLVERALYASTYPSYGDAPASAEESTHTRKRKARSSSPSSPSPPPSPSSSSRARGRVKGSGEKQQQQQQQPKKKKRKNG
jgi:hypothetical protein